ncbi:Uncharacterised protein [Mycobacteroides abscessus subsp. abscessus]|nr:Uncharacterised protein [Mycobacteroides abscessus subsp. abscessus]
MREQSGRRTQLRRRDRGVIRTATRHRAPQPAGDRDQIDERLATDNDAASIGHASEATRDQFGDSAFRIGYARATRGSSPRMRSRARLPSRSAQARTSIATFRNGASACWQYMTPPKSVGHV